MGEKKEEIEDKNESEKVGGWKKAESQEIFDAANAIKDRVEQQAKNDGKAPFEIFETIQGTKQVVAGTNLKIKFKVGKERFIQVLVFRSLPPISYEVKSVTY